MLQTEVQGSRRAGKPAAAAACATLVKLEVGDGLEDYFAKIEKFRGSTVN